MDSISIVKSMKSFIIKYKYALLVAIIGLILMLIPADKTDYKEQENDFAEKQEIHDLEFRLSELLSCVSGAGRVEVLLSVSCGEETLYQVNKDKDIQNNTSSERITTVTVTDSQRNETGLIKQINPPSYMGAIVLCQGADNMTVRLSIVEAVCNATGLGANKVSVLKMQ